MKNLENILSHSACLTQEQMQSYLAETLDKEQVLQIENHISDCMFCSDALEGLQLVDTEESAAVVSDLKNHFDALLFSETEEKAAPIHEQKVNPAPELTAKKGGRKIGWAAAAGLFFLIFGAGLAVFSYINDHTNWLKKENAVATTKGTKSKDDLDVKKSKSTGRELETFSITEEDLDLDNEAISAETTGERKEEEKRSRKIPPSSAVKKNVLAKNSPPPSPAPAVAAETSPDDRFKEKSKIATPKKRDEAPIVAKAEKADVGSNYGNLSTRNAYEIPKYEGKLKDRKAPAVSSVNKKRLKSSRAEESEMQDIDAVQSTGKYNKKGYEDNSDNYTKGNKAYDQGDYKQSIKLYKRALRQKNLKNRNEVMYQLALAYEKTGNQTKAATLFEQLENIGAYQNRARSGLKRVRAR